MRVLYLSRSDVFDGTQSLTNIAASLLGECLKKYPDLEVTWVVPRTASDEAVHLGIKSSLPPDAAARMKVLKIATDGFGRMMGYYLTEEIANLFRQVKAEFPYDLVLNQHPALTVQYKTILANRYRAGAFSVEVPLVNWHLWTSTLDQLELAPEYYVGEADVASESLGAFYADRNVWESEHLMRSHLRSLRRWVSPAAVKSIVGKSEHLNTGVEVQRIIEASSRVRAKRIEKGEPAALLWGGRFAAVKRTKDTFRLMRQVSTRNPSSDVLVTTSKTSVPDWVAEQYPDWRIETKINKDGWISRLGLGDVFLCNSVSESYGAAWLEMLAGGLLGVFEKAWWLDGFLPEWYPFVADTKEEQMNMASALLKQWPDGVLWKEYAPKVQQWLLEEHDSSTAADRLYSVLKKEHDRAIEQERSKDSTIGKLAIRAAESLWEETGLPVAAPDVFHRMSQLSDTDRTWGGKGDIVTAFFLRRALLAAGWKDLGEPGLVRLIPEGEDQ